MLPTFFISAPEELPGLVECIRGMLEGRDAGDDTLGESSNFK
jgi:hypothetical protein